MSDNTAKSVRSADQLGVALMDQRPQADIPTRSPLHHVAGQKVEPGVATPGVFLWEDALKTHIILRGDVRNPSFRDGIEAATGLALPDPLSSTSSETWSLSWITPDEWLLVGPGDEAFSMESSLRDHLAGHYAVINVGGGQTLVRLAGHDARSVLMKSCPYDVHDRNFPVGKVVTTVLAKSQATLRRVGEQDWELVVRRSFADYIWRWLVDAADEYDLQIGTPPAADKASRSGKKTTVRAVES